MSYKIIKKSEYNKLKSDNKKINNDLENTLECQKLLIDQLEKKKKNVETLQNEVSKERYNNISLQKQISSLIDTNQKLNTWIEKILNEVGIQEIHERTGITIPIYSEQLVTSNPDKQFNNDFRKRKEVIIPELRFVRVGLGGNYVN